MNLRMAIQATFNEQPVRHPQWRHARAAVNGAWMECLHVALLAKPGGPDFQQPRLGGTMGRMAVDTAVADGGVLPQERSPLFRMALVAGLVHRRLDQEQGSERAVGVMAV